MVVTSSIGASASFSLNMAAVAPGIFRTADPSNTKRQNAAALFYETAWQVMPVAMATALKLGSNCRGGAVTPFTPCGEPARPGDRVAVYATGLGLATPGGDPEGAPLATGSAAPRDGGTLYQLPVAPAVTVGGATATVLSCGIAPGFAGMYVVEMVIPDGAPDGDDVPLVIQLGDSSDTATIAVKN